MSNTRVACIGASAAAILAVIIARGAPEIGFGFFALAIGAVMAVALFGK